MPPVESATPNPEEIASQLKRMLASRRFTNAPNQADFLALVVRRALKGKETPGHVIAKALFPGKFAKRISTDVRVTAGNLRGTLKKYYAAEGGDDLVVISLPDPPPDKSVKLPEGKAYTPVFSYNPRHAARKSFRLGEHYLRQKSPMELAEALEEFEKALKSPAVDTSSGSRAEAWIGMAETACLALIYHVGSSVRKGSFEGAVGAGVKAMTLSPDYWRAHASLGAALMCSHDLETASRAFDAALKLNPEKTREYGWYPAFLITVGKHAEALAHARRQSEDRIDDPSAHALYGFYLYVLRQFESAKAVLDQALKLDRNHWLGLLAMSLVCFALDQPDDALKHYDRILFLLDEERSDWILPGLACLYAHAARNTPGDRIDVILQWAPRLIAEIDHEIHWFQVALAALGEGETETAIESLRRAWTDQDPLVWWLHLWPIFDSLREHPDFKALLALMNLPPAAPSLT